MQDYERLGVPRTVLGAIKHFENELDPPKPLVYAGNDFGVKLHNDRHDWRAQRWTDEFGAASRPPLERPELKATVDRLKLLAITNPAEAVREANYLLGATNPLLDMLPPKKPPAPKSQTARLQEAILRIDTFHRTNKVLAQSLRTPILKAKLVEQNSHHLQSLEEGDPNLIAGVFEFTCPKCGQKHLIGATVAEWHARKTFAKPVYCTPNGSQHSFAFELEGIEG